MTRFYLKELQSAISVAVEAEGLRPLAARLDVPLGLVRGVLEGRNLTVDSAATLSEKLNFQFYIGPPRSASPVPSADASGPDNCDRDFDPDAVTGSTLMLDHYGDIAAGGSDHPNDGRIWFAGTSGETVIPPPGFTDAELVRHGGLVALTVRGRSMVPKYHDGDYAYIYKDDPLRFEPEKLVGRDCVVTLTGAHDHAVYLKRLRRPDNGKDGFFNLESLNRDWDVMVDMPLNHILPVRAVKHRL